MSSNNNGEATGMIIALMIVGMILYFLVIGFLIFATVYCLTLTVICVFAWNKKRRLGKYTIYPDEARAYVLRGLLGGVLLPAAFLICCWWSETPIEEEAVWIAVIAGYVIGSLGVEYILRKIEAGALVSIEPLRPAPTFEVKAIPAPPQKPFPYASWDDEEAGS